MNMRALTGFLALTALMVWACQPQEPRAEEAAAVDTAAIVASIDSLRSGYQDAVAERDWERLGAMVTSAAVMVPPGGAAWDSLYAAAEGPFPEGATLEIASTEVGVLSADWAYDMGNGTITWTPEGAAEPRTLRDTYLVLLHRTEDGWKLHREVASSRQLPERGN